MNAREFAQQLEQENNLILSKLRSRQPPVQNEVMNVKNLLKMALKNEIEATELAAYWIPSTPEIDVKLSFARQAGDEAKHYRLIAERLSELGEDLFSFSPLAQG